jgi:hypothetical protein
MQPMLPCALIRRSSRSKRKISMLTFSILPDGRYPSQREHPKTNERAPTARRASVRA